MVMLEFIENIDLKCQKYSLNYQCYCIIINWYFAMLMVVFSYKRQVTAGKILQLIAGEGHDNHL
jgi:hypothetical protein